MTLRIDKPPFLVTADVLALIAVLYLLVRATLQRTLVGLAAAAGGALLAAGAVWLFGDVLDLFGVELTTVTRMWVVLGGAAIGLALANLVGSQWWRKAVAGLGIALFALVAAAGINVEFGEYRNLNDALGVVPYPALSVHFEHGEVVNAGTGYAATWTGSSTAGQGAMVHGTTIPSKGEIGRVHIPGTRSGFDARDAVVYLPPAALVAHPPVLPVLYAFSGQPGAPADMFTAGRIGAYMDAFAAKHGGMAPIVVAPDQLGGPGRNPMCVNSVQFGNAATYLLVDVRRWVESHFRVSSDPAAWSVFGYSQGATCAVQFATAHPALFGSALAASSELGPTLGNPQRSISAGFGGSAAAFHAAQPAAIMAASSPYRHTTIVFGVGQNDQRYTRFAHTLVAHAARAGITTTLLVSPGSAHDWTTVRYVLAHGFPIIAARLGLTP